MYYFILCTMWNLFAFKRTVTGVVAAEESEILVHKVRGFSYWNASTAPRCSKLCKKELLAEQRSMQRKAYSST